MGDERTAAIGRLIVSQKPLLPRAAPSTQQVDATAVMALLERLDQQAIECHSLMVVRHGHVVAEGWWTPYSSDRPHLLYSLTKSFTGVAVGLAVDDGRLSLDDRVVDVLADQVPDPVAEPVRQLTVHHLLSMSTGHRDDLLDDAWTLEPDDLVRGFLSIPPPDPVGSRHAYNNPTSFVLARLLERVTDRTLPDLLDERLFGPMGVADVAWERLRSGATFGFHGLHLTTEAVAAFGVLLLQGGRWRARQLVSPAWLDLATRPQVETAQVEDGSRQPDWLQGYGYHFWMSRHGYRGDGAFGQFCIVVPERDLVLAVTAATTEMQKLLDAVWDHLLPGLDQPGNDAADRALANRLRHLALPMPTGEHRAGVRADGRVAATASTALPAETPLTVVPDAGGWSVQIDADGAKLEIAVGHGKWRESAPLGRPVVAAGGWRDGTYVADLFVITSPSRVRITLDGDRATTTWNQAPLVGPALLPQLRSPLITRPDRS